MMPDATADSPVLTLRGIRKSFGTFTALHDVDLQLQPGRVHGVLGENGAGKTTLMRIAAGLLRPDAGRIATPDGECRALSPADAARAGIAMVHQHFMLVPSMTVAENCVIGRRDTGMWLSRRRIEHDLRELAGRLGLDVDPQARVETLSVGQRQRVEILRALQTARRVLILDEPTAVLTPHETDGLFAALRRLCADGLAIVFISHKLNEVTRICDDLTILRRGRCVYAGPAVGLTHAQIAEHMVGSPLAEPVIAPRSVDGPVRLDVRGLTCRDAWAGRGLHDVTLTVRGGEIHGIAGVEGNGQDLLAAAIVGVRRIDRGSVAIDGRDVTHRPVRRRTQLGLAHIAEDRLAQALAPAMSIPENLALRSFRDPPLARCGWLSRRRMRRQAENLVAQFDVRVPSGATSAGQLSGGNQQKLVVARELSGNPGVILAHNPVRGLDIAATQFVFDQLRAARDRGAAILLIHSDLDELLALADRVSVLYAGRLIPTNWPHASCEHIGRMMLGLPADGGAA